MDLNKQEKSILDYIQQDFPISSDPYALIAQQVGCSREEAHKTISHLKESGIIRRIGASFVPAGLGYISSLVAAKVESSALLEAANLASSFMEVTHNYEREDVYNLWFTIIAESEDRLNEIADSVRACEGVKSLHILPALKTFKIIVDFNFSGAEHEPEAPEKGEEKTKLEFDEKDRSLIRYTCGSIDASLTPFKSLAETLDMDQADIIDRLMKYKKAGALRRFGAVLRHQSAGYKANGMSTWNIKDSDVDIIGKQMASCDEISHCYERPRFDDWPYNVYGMIHCKTDEEVINRAKQISKETGIDDFRVLFSIREFKKTSMVYMEKAQI